MQNIAVISFCFLLMAISPGAVYAQIQPEIQGWNILSDSYEDALLTIAAAPEYHINHLQLSHDLVMDLSEIKVQAKREVVNQLVAKAHTAGIKQVVLWDHAFYKLNYYPEQFKTGLNGTIDLDNPGFWNWFKQDYRNMMNLVPDADGLVLTFIETGARAENQYSEKLKTGAEKLAAVVDAVASVVCDELGKKLYIRTFAYTDAEYENTIGCIGHIKNNKIILMMKETPHDFFLTHPNDKYAGTINRPTIIEFDAGNEFNGQGIIANTWPEYIIKRWSELIRRPHVIGYVARTDRYGDTHLVGTPNEILLYTLKRFSEDQKVTADHMYEEFISEKYGPKAVPILQQAFKLAFDIVTSSFYTLGTNIANHSKMDFDPYKSSYGRHVSGKWIDPPVVFVSHGVNREFHYWKDVIEHLAPALLKETGAALKVEAPLVIQNNWVTPSEKMDEIFLKYIITEKHYGTEVARKALSLIEQAKPVLSKEAYNQVYQLFYRTLLTARLYEATATAYFGYRVYARGAAFQTKWLKETMQNALDSMLMIAGEIDKYEENVPVGQWKWRNDAKTAREYYHLITETGWKDYGNVIFNLQK
jgi:hypothetical protein